MCMYFLLYRECPFAVEAAQGLLSLNVRGAEVISLMVSGDVRVPNLEWLMLFSISFCK